MNLAVRLVHRRPCPFNQVVRMTVTRNFSIGPVRLAKAKPSEDMDAPVKFTASPGYRNSPTFIYARSSEEDPPPAYQFPVITISIASLLIYFCILREESDIDAQLGGNNLYAKVKGLEKVQLETVIKHYEEHGMDTTELKKRLEELLLEEARLQSSD